MNIHEFNEKVVKVTIKDLGDEIKNKTHMILGMTSEIADEFTVACIEGDPFNYYEELGDNEWFAVGYCNMYNLDLESVTTFPTDIEDEIFYDYKQYENYSSKNLSSFPVTEKTEIFGSCLIRIFGILSSILKKEITSNVMKYEGVEVTKEYHEKLLRHVFYCIQHLVDYPLIRISEVNAKSIEEVRDRIANKLLVVRHKGQAMTTESDLNRDLKAEREVLEK